MNGKQTKFGNRQVLIVVVLLLASYLLSGCAFLGLPCNRCKPCEDREYKVSLKDSLGEVVDSFIVTSDNAAKQFKEKIPIKLIYADDSRPVLGSIFFDLESTGIPEEYTTFDKTGEIGENNINKIEPLSNTLAVVLIRMRNDSTIKITLRYKLPSGSKDENSRRRVWAENVNKYLIDAGIDSNRISISNEPLEHLTSLNPKLDIEDRQEDNARIDIYSGSAYLSDPVIYDDLIEIDSAGVKNITFDVSIKNQDGNCPATIIILKNGNVPLAKETVENSEMQSLSYPIEYLMDEKDLKELSEIGELRMEFEIKCDGGERGCFCEKDLKIDSFEAGFELVADTVHVSRLMITLFDYDSCDLTATAKRQIRTFLATFFYSSITVLDIEIQGFACKLGDQNDNKKLANCRADSVIDFIQSNFKPLAKYVYIKPYTHETYPNKIESNDSPQERAYSRSAQIVVKWKY